MSAKRDEAAKILAQVPQTVEGVKSDTQGTLFTQWTNMTHEQMKKSWRANPNGPKLLTACGGFAAKYAGLIGVTGLADIFELQQSLSDANMPHAWVTAAPGVKPDVGDILRHKVYHVDVAAGWDGAKLKRVAAGQSSHPRPAKNIEAEFDALKWVTGGGPYNWANLEGWLDLDKYFGPKPAPGPTFGWLDGWWKVWDTNTYWYHFGPNGVVKYTKTQPASFGGPPKVANNTGSYTYNMGELVVTWNKVGGSTACRETFYNAAPGCRQMNANSSLYGPLVATKVG